MKVDNLVAKQIHIRIEIQLMCDELAVFVSQLVFELACIHCDLLMRYGSLESAIQEIVRCCADSSPVRAVFTTSVQKNVLEVPVSVQSAVSPYG